MFRALELEVCLIFVFHNILPWKLTSLNMFNTQFSLNFKLREYHLYWSVIRTLNKIVHEVLV